MKEYRSQAISKKGDDIPLVLQNKEETIAFYRLFIDLTKYTSDQGIEFSQEVDSIIKRFKIVDWQSKLDVIRKMNFFIGEYLIDEFNMSIDSAEELAEKCIEVAKKRY